MLLQSSETFSAVAFLGKPLASGDTRRFLPVDKLSLEVSPLVLTRRKCGNVLLVQTVCKVDGETCADYRLLGAWLEFVAFTA